MDRERESRNTEDIRGACCCYTIICLAIFFGLLFGVNYSEVKSAEYIPTICHCLSAEIVPRFCCNLNCNTTCTDTSLGLPQCKPLLLQSQSLSPIECKQNSAFCPKDADCDNGYYCCEHCCYETAKSSYCTDSCCKSINQGCRMTCIQCYNVELNLTYYVGQQQQNLIYTKVFSKSFYSESLRDAEVFLSAHEQNSTFLCYYNPSSITEIILDSKHFTPWKWVLFAFSAFALFICLMALTGFALHACIKDSQWLYLIVFFIWIGIILPLVILLPVWKYGVIAKKESMILMGFICSFAACGSLPIVINVLNTLEFSSLQATFLSFIGLIVPLAYVSIILYVPSSSTIIYSILSIQLALVILTIICKCNGMNLMDLLIMTINLAKELKERIIMVKKLVKEHIMYT